MNLLVNLPRGFFETPALEPLFERLERRAELRRRSHDRVEQIAEDVRWADALIMWAWPVLDAGLLESAKRLRFVGHLNATQAQAKAELERGLLVSEARRGWSPAVAEMALALALCCLRRVSSHHAAMRAGSERWVSDFPRDIDPRERQLSGRSVGVVGFGGVGQRFAELVAPFGVRLRAYDPYLPPEAAARFGASIATLDELSRSSEVVVLCAADNPGTRRLFSRELIELLPAGALLINVGRASLLDSAALFERVSRGEIFAALDVFDDEPLAVDSPWRKLENAWLTPHRAGAPLDAVHDILGRLVDDFEAFVDGRPLAHALGPDSLHALHG